MATTVCQIDQIPGQSSSVARRISIPSSWPPVGGTAQDLPEFAVPTIRAAAGLPGERRAELLADLREHIAVAQADLAPDIGAGVRTILERLGDPAAIAAEARHEPPALLAEARPASARSAPSTPVAGPAMPLAGDPPVRARRTGLWVGIAVGVVALLVCAGCAVAGLGMFAWSGPVVVRTEVVEAPFEPLPRPSPTTMPFDRP